MTPELHQVLLGCGYQYIPAQQLPEDSLIYSRSHQKGYYVKHYDTAGGPFLIALLLSNDPYTDLPVAYAAKVPESCKERLIPHLSQEQILCYVEHKEADWDPNDLGSLYSDVDQQIQLTLDKAIKAITEKQPDDTELEGEFAAYWRALDDLYVLENPEKGKNMSTFLLEREESKRREYVIAPSDEDGAKRCHKWLTQRAFSYSDITAHATAHYIKVRPSQLSGVKWPPSNLHDTLTWLALVDHNARNLLVECLYYSKSKRHTVLLDIERQDMLAFYVEIDVQVAGSNRKKKSKRKRPQIRHIETLLKSRFATSEFKRLCVIKADRDTILSRNRRRPNVGNLSGKRVALVGCGTIGGYLAGLLLRGGAGCGKGCFHLYDPDEFTPHNFGRHALPGRNFGLSKALALEVNLQESVHIANEIKGFGVQFPITPDLLSDYDIIIDATGRPPVSKRLAFTVRTVENENRPTLIHAFNDGNGRASKVLVDDGSCCYGCMVSDPATHRNDVDLRFEHIDQASERHINCGSTHTPYDAAVSHITAALAQEAALNTLEPELPWTYNEHLLDGTRTKKPKCLKRQAGCRICG